MWGTPTGATFVERKFGSEIGLRVDEDEEARMELDVEIDSNEPGGLLCFGKVRRRS